MLIKIDEKISKILDEPLQCGHLHEERDIALIQNLALCSLGLSTLSVAPIISGLNQAFLLDLKCVQQEMQRLKDLCIIAKPI